MRSDSPVKPVIWMDQVRLRMINFTRYKFYLIISIWKAAFFFLGTLIIVKFKGLVMTWTSIFDKFQLSLKSHDYTVSEIMDRMQNGMFYSDYNGNIYEEWSVVTIKTIENVPVFVLIIHICCNLLAYVMGKFACKVQIQNVSFAAPLTFVVPLSFTLIMSSCGSRYVYTIYLYGTL